MLNLLKKLLGLCAKNERNLKNYIIMALRSSFIVSGLHVHGKDT